MATITPTEAREHIFAGWRCRSGKRSTGLPTLAQAQVLAGLAAGLTQKEIAKARGVSPATVKAAVATVLFHLHATRAAGAVAQAMRRGWIAPLLLALMIGAMNPNSEALRIRQPTRTRTQVSTSRVVSRRDVGSLYA